MSLPRLSEKEKCLVRMVFYYFAGLAAFVACMSQVGLLLSDKNYFEMKISYCSIIAHGILAIWFMRRWWLLINTYD